MSERLLSCHLELAHLFISGSFSRLLRFNFWSDWFACLLHNPSVWHTDFGFKARAVWRRVRVSIYLMKQRCQTLVPSLLSTWSRFRTAEISAGPNQISSCFLAVRLWPTLQTRTATNCLFPNPYPSFERRAKRCRRRIEQFLGHWFRAFGSSRTLMLKKKDTGLLPASAVATEHAQCSPGRQVWIGREQKGGKNRT